MINEIRDAKEKAAKLELINEICNELEKIEELSSDEEDRDYYVLSSLESYIKRKREEIEKS